MTDWQELLAWMRLPEVQAAVARYEPEADAEEQEQMAMELDMAARGRAGA
jgi:hypothetical protein